MIIRYKSELMYSHVPAKELGLANAWIDRQRLSERGSWGATRSVEQRPETDFLFFTMAEMAAAVSA